MKVSLKWLSEYVDIHGLSPETIAERLTFAGIEVEDIIKAAVGDHLVIGKVLTCEPLEGSDHLHVVKIDEGLRYGIQQIVCGAPNIAVGQKVIISRPGATIAKGKITQTVIKGVESNGMVCSLLELGVEAKYLNQAQIDGIEVLPEDAEVGNEDVLAYLGLDDIILDLKLLANRSDCLSLLNVAKEVGALFDRPVALPSVTYAKGHLTDAKVETLTKKCPQFSIKVVRGVKVTQSPDWLKQILRSQGVRSINNLVDIGNYVMLLTGQPLHMYDLKRLPSAHFIVKDDYEGNLVALDGQSYAIQKGDVVITVDGKPRCLGGIMGAKDCEVDETTTDVAIEAANFESATIRRTSIRLNLGSESSQRFIKGINPHQYDFVLMLASKLVKTLGDAKAIENTVTVDHVNHNPTVLHASAKRINFRLGTSFTREEILAALEKVGIKITHVKGNRFKAKIPSHRIDITGEADLCEEVIRQLGFEHVKSVLPRLDTTVGMLNDGQRKKKLVQEYLLGRGLYEALTYTLVNKEEAELFRYLNHDATYSLLHPMTDDHEVVRAHILPSLLLSVQYNVARQNKDVPMFEISEMFTKNGSSTHLAVVLSGEKHERQLMSKRPYTFYDMKGLFEGLMALLGIEPSRYKLEALVSDKEEFHPGRTAVIKLGKTTVGVLGELHPKAMKKYDLGKTGTVAMELNLSEFIALRTNAIKMVPTPRYPSVERDLAFIVSKAIPSSDIVKTARMAGRELVKKVEVFDHYEGANIPENTKSLAIKVTYQDPNKTLVESEVSLAEERIKQELYRAYGVTIRG